MQTTFSNSRNAMFFSRENGIGLKEPTPQVPAANLEQQNTDEAKDQKEDLLNKNERRGYQLCNATTDQRHEEETALQSITKIQAILRGNKVRGKANKHGWRTIQDSSGFYVAHARYDKYGKLRGLHPHIQNFKSKPDGNSGSLKVVTGEFTYDNAILADRVLLSSKSAKVMKNMEEDIYAFVSNKDSFLVQDQVADGKYIVKKMLGELSTGMLKICPELRNLHAYKKLADDLKELNKAGIIHRDIKSKNIVTDGKKPFLTDWDTVARRGTVKTGLGTEAYLPLAEMQAGLDTAEKIFDGWKDVAFFQNRFGVRLDQFALLLTLMETVAPTTEAGARDCKAQHKWIDKHVKPESREMMKRFVADPLSGDLDADNLFVADVVQWSDVKQKKNFCYIF
jgi:serine/threonine protein kinase